MWSVVGTGIGTGIVMIVVGTVVVVVDGGSVVLVVVVVDGSVVVVVGAGMVDVVVGGCALPAVSIVVVVVVVLVESGSAAVRVGVVFGAGPEPRVVVEAGAAAATAAGVLWLTSSRSGDAVLTEAAPSCQGSAHEREGGKNGAAADPDGVAADEGAREYASGSVDVPGAAFDGSVSRWKKPA